MRKELGIDIAIRDIYKYTTIKELASHLEQMRAINSKQIIKKQEARTSPSSKENFKEKSKGFYPFCVILQSLSFYLTNSLSAIPFALTILLVLAIINGQITVSLQTAVALIVGISLISFPLMLGLSIFLKWLIIGKYKAGKYPLWSFYYFRWWLVNKFVDLSGARTFTGTPIINLYLKLMGVRIWEKLCYRYFANIKF